MADIFSPPWFGLPESRRHLFAECVKLWDTEYKSRLEGSQLDESEVRLRKSEWASEIMDIVLEQHTGSPLSHAGQQLRKVVIAVEKIESEGLKVSRSGQRVIAINVATGEQTIYDSVADAARGTGAPTNMIHLVARGDRKQIKGFTFKKVIAEGVYDLES